MLMPKGINFQRLPNNSEYYTFSLGHKLLIIIQVVTTGYNSNHTLA